MSDPNNLEGNPPTREERAAMARELDRVAPTPRDKFALMFGRQPTPRTNAVAETRIVKGKPREITDAEFARELERELADAREEVFRLNHALEQSSLIYDAAREQRDRLATALRACREDSCELLAERYWWADEPRCDYRKRYDETAENIVKADEALDALNPHSASTSPVIE